MRKFSLLVLIAWGFACRAAGDPLKNGDLIFIMNPAGQGKAIQLATGSKYTHVGIVFIENGKPVVYHAVEPVMKSPLNEFVGMSVDGKYEVRRLKDQKALAGDVLSKMRRQAISQLGRHYDWGFSWSDDELYCSEYVWKLYSSALHVEIGSPRPLKAFDLSNALVKSTLQHRYGDAIPLDEKMISPGDMFSSDLLE
jgi:hypothetical protein